MAQVVLVGVEAVPVTTPRLVGPACRDTDTPVGLEASRLARDTRVAVEAVLAAQVEQAPQTPRHPPQEVRAASACSPRSPAQHSGTRVAVVDRGCRHRGRERQVV